ncbi:MAG: hypothetical protein Q9160_003643 [Pyrenula sp. 1 TL-2023]
MSDDNIEEIPGGEDSVNQADDNGIDNELLAPEPPLLSPKQPKSPSGSSAELKKSALGSNPPFKDNSERTQSESLPLPSQIQPKNPTRSSTIPTKPFVGNESPSNGDFEQIKSKGLPLTSPKELKSLSRSSTDSRNSPRGNNSPTNADSTQTKAKGEYLIRLDSHPSTSNQDKAPASFADLGQLNSAGLSLTSDDKGTQSVEVPPPVDFERISPPSSSRLKTPSSPAFTGAPERQQSASAESSVRGDEANGAEQQPYLARLSKRVDIWSQTASQAIAQFSQAIAQFLFALWARIRTTAIAYYNRTIVSRLRRQYEAYIHLGPRKAIPLFILNFWFWSVTVRYTYYSVWSRGDIGEILLKSLFSFISYFSNDSRCLLLGRSGHLYEPSSRWNCLRRIFEDTFWGSTSGGVHFFPFSGLLRLITNEGPFRLVWTILKKCWVLVHAIILEPWPYDDTSHFKFQPLGASENFDADVFPIIDPIVFPPYPTPSSHHHADDPISVSDSAATASYTPRFSSPETASWLPNLYSFAVGFIVCILLCLIISRVAYRNPHQWERIRSRSLSLSSGGGGTSSSSSSAVTPTSPLIRPASARSIRNGGDDDYAHERYTETPEREVAAPRGRKRSVKVGAGTGTVGRPPKGGAVAKRTRSRSRGP